MKPTDVLRNRLRHVPPKMTALGLSVVLGVALGVFLMLGGRNPAEAQHAPPITGNIYQNQAMNPQTSVGDNIMILLDGSYSMAERLGNGRENKMNAAKRVVLDVLRNVPPTTRVGLRIYGDSANGFSACRATSVLAPLAQNNRNLIASKLIGIRPTGATPISYAVIRSLEEDFNYAPGNKSIIMISDGLETCGEDPCDVAVRMQKRGINVKINVVGYGLNDYAAVKQMRCVALATKGKYYTANTAAELANSLNQAMAIGTHVQGTIVTPVNPPQQAVEAPVTVPPAPVKQPEDKLLPPAVPIQRNTR